MSCSVAVVRTFRPHATTLVSLLEYHEATQASHAMNATLVVVRVKQHSFDYHGYHALWRYRHHRLVAGQGYLYTVDTTLAHPGFPRRLDDLGRIFQARCQAVLHARALCRCRMRICAPLGLECSSTMATTLTCRISPSERPWTSKRAALGVERALSFILRARLSSSTPARDAASTTSTRRAVTLASAGTMMDSTS